MNRTTRRYNRENLRRDRKERLRAIRDRNKELLRNTAFLRAVKGKLTYRELIGSWPGPETDAELREALEQPRWGMGE